MGAGAAQIEAGQWPSVIAVAENRARLADTLALPGAPGSADGLRFADHHALGFGLVYLGAVLSLGARSLGRALLLAGLDGVTAAAGLRLHGLLLAPKRKELKQKVITAMHNVYDPEIPVNIYDLGLIYRLEVDEQGRIRLSMKAVGEVAAMGRSFEEALLKAVRSLEIDRDSLEAPPELAHAAPLTAPGTEPPFQPLFGTRTAPALLAVTWAYGRRVVPRLEGGRWAGLWPPILFAFAAAVAGVWWAIRRRRRACPAPPSRR